MTPEVYEQLMCLLVCSGWSASEAEFNARKISGWMHSGSPACWKRERGEQEIEVRRSEHGFHADLQGANISVCVYLGKPE